LSTNLVLTVPRDFKGVQKILGTYVVSIHLLIKWESNNTTLTEQFQNPIP
jgi:hypothetical protein